MISICDMNIGMASVSRGYIHVGDVMLMTNFGFGDRTLLLVTSLE